MSKYSIKFDPSFLKGGNLDIVVAGCGGTGSKLVPLLVQHIHALNQKYFNLKIRLCLYDFDIVELKNVKRQNFFEFDVGKYKSEALAERYSSLYGITIDYSKGRFVANNHKFNRNIFLNYNTLVFFDCTDSISSRQYNENEYRAFCNSATPSQNYYICCGNEKENGQVFVSSYGIDPIDVLSNLEYNNVKFIGGFTDFFKLEPEKVKPVSCAEIPLEVEEQTMPINNLIAQLSFNIFYKLLNEDKIDYYMVRGDLDNNFSKEYFKEKNDVKLLVIKGFCSKEVYEEIENALCKYSTDDSYNKALDQITSVMESIYEIRRDVKKIKELLKKTLK